MLKYSDIKTAIFIHLVRLIKTGYCGANNFILQVSRKTSTTLSFAEDNLTLNINSTLVMILA